MIPINALLRINYLIIKMNEKCLVLVCDIP